MLALISIGLDVGTGFVKCVSDTKTVRFPSLYAYRLPHLWDRDQKKTEGVGDDAVEMLRDPDTISIRPVMFGKPVNEDAFSKLVAKAVQLCSESRDALGEMSEIAIVIGLPYEAKDSRNNLQKMISKLLKPKFCDVVPQALGTLASVSKTDGIVVSIGQGTTEIVPFVGSTAMKGMSVHHAVGYISSNFGEYSYLDHSIFSSKEASKLVLALADSLVNRIQQARASYQHLPVIISGGGMLVPGMEQVLRSKLEFIVPDDPVMSNAQGLHKIASWYCGQITC